MAGTGTLTIQNNGDILTDRTHLGFNAGVTGTATVTGAGSSLTAVEVFVGSSGTGTLNINSSGRVDTGSDAWVGNLAGSNGTANIDGTGSMWNISGNLAVGNEATGTLNITASGQVRRNKRGLSAMSSGSTGTANVDGLGSQWSNSGDLIIGNAGSGTLHISGGGRVGNTSSYIGGYFGSTNPGTGEVTVTGAGSLWTNSGEVNVGFGGDGSLDITDGGRVDSVGSVHGHIDS